MEPCKSCNFENTAGSLFCGGCGNDMGIKCDRCGEINRNQAFCTNCGQVVSSDLEARYESQNLSDTENIQYEPHQPVNSEDQLLPKPGQLVDLITVSVSAYKQNFKSFLILALVNGVPALLIGIIVRALLETETISFQDLQQYGDSQLSENFLSELKTIPTWKIFTVLIFILIVPGKLSGVILPNFCVPSLSTYCFANHSKKSSAKLPGKLSG